ncbi:LemA family protein [Candidatus Micrarchaeota archaeon]|nr:LemA family protein [Candidatus Micrarchaeota archaeon]
MVLEILAIGLLVVLGLFVVFFVGVYNRLIVLKNRIDNSLSQIDVQLKRRYDLIPNLVETVKGYAKHEKETFKDIAKYRSGLINGSIEDRAAANNMLTAALGRLFAVSENYPQLRANENFIKLQDELTGTENKISYVRTAYNDTVLEFNNSIQVFPSSIVAGTLGYTKKEYLETPEEEKKNVKVKFE